MWTGRAAFLCCGPPDSLRRLLADRATRGSWAFGGGGHSGFHTAFAGFAEHSAFVVHRLAAPEQALRTGHDSAHVAALVPGLGVLLATGCTMADG